MKTMHQRCKMCFVFQLILAGFYLTRSVYADDFRPVKSISHVRLIKVRHDLNHSIISETTTSNSLVACATSCTNKLTLTSFYFVQDDQTCHCNNGVDNSTEDDPSKPAIHYGYFEISVEVYEGQGTRKRRILPSKADCLDIRNAGFTSDGVYTIQPAGQDPVDTWCDMENGGWTVMQRRQDGSEEFYRGWSDYVSGFGNRTGEFWLGLDNIHALTTQPSELYIYVESFGDREPLSGYVHYSTFVVYGPNLKYKIYVDGSNNSCTMHDPFYKGNNMSFSTFDYDNDVNSGEHCAQLYQGAWWYEQCHHANLNGVYSDNPVEFGQGLSWPTCWGIFYSVKKSVMKTIRILI